MASSVGTPQVLRVAAVWGTTVVALQTLRRGESFALGDARSAALPMPDGLEISSLPLRSVAGGWELDAHGAVSGILRLRGRNEDPVAVARSNAPVPVMPGDYGLLQYGLFSVFFQYTTPAVTLTVLRGPELLAVLAIFCSTVLHIGVLGLLRTLMTPPPIAKPLELTNPDEYAARFGLRRALIEEPPPPAPNAGDKQGAVASKEAALQKTPPGGKKIAGAEGKLGMNGSADRTDLTGDNKPTMRYGGLSEVLDSETGKEIQNTLRTIDTVASALGGLNSQNLVLGGGSGTGLRGGGAAGGGNAAGVAFGAGTLNTGWGPENNGAGNAAGRPGGANARGGPAAPAPPGEATVAVAAGVATTKGGLSQEQIRRVVMAHQGALRACYETEAQKNPGLKGGVTVAWQIDPGGSVTGASLASTTLGNARVEGCVVRQVKGWHFPASDSPSVVAGFPFKFGVGG